VNLFPWRFLDPTGKMSVSSQRFLEDSQSFEVVFDGIDAVLDSTMAAIDAKWLASLECPLAADMAMLKISKMLAWALLAHDGEVDSSDPSKVFEFMTPDVEPTMPLVDTWARGSVPIRKPEEPQTADFKKLKKETDEKTPSVSSFRTSNSGTAKTSNSKVSAATHKGNRKSSTGVNMVEEDPTGQIVDLDDPDEDFADLSGNGELFQLLAKQKKTKGGGADALAGEEVKSEFELLQEGIDKQLAEMKVKKFAVDAAGKVVPLQPVKPEALPPYAIAADTKITSPRGASSKGKGAVAGDDGKRKKKIIRVAGSRTIEDDAHFKPSNTLATVLSSGESIAPQAGVSLKAGNNFREGPTLPEDPNKISRKNYMSRSLLADSQSRAQTGAGSPTALDLEGSMGTLGVGFGESFASPTPGGLPQSMASHTVRFPDVDPLEGGRRILSQKEILALESNPTDDELGLGPKNTTGLVQAAVLPLKKDPSTQLFDYKSDKMPKDRDTVINQRPPSERKHQLAPPPGRVSIRDENNSGAIGGPGSPSGSVASGQSSLAGSRIGGGLPQGKSTAKSPEKPLDKSGVIKPVRPDLARAMN